MSADDPTEIDYLEALAREILKRVRTLVPALIISYSNGLAEVQVARRGRDRDGRPYDIAPIPSCPAIWPRFSGMSIVGEYTPGDEVMLGITDRSLDAWIQKGGIVDAEDDRMFSFSDAVVLFGTASSTAKPLPETAGSLLIGRDDGTARIRITMPQGGAPPVEVEAAEIKLGANATLAAARSTDPVGFTVAMGTWMSQVAGFINGLVGGTVSPAVPPSFGTITSGSTKVKTE